MRQLGQRGGGEGRRRTELNVDGVERCSVQRLADVRVRERTLRSSGDIVPLFGTFRACTDLLDERGVARRRPFLNVEVDPGMRARDLSITEVDKDERMGAYPSSTASPNGRGAPEPPKNEFHI